MTLKRDALEAGARFYWEEAATECPWHDLPAGKRDVLVNAFGNAVAVYETECQFISRADDDLDLPLSEDWLKEVGFRWHQLDRQPDKHWLLWIGGGLRERKRSVFTGREDLGIEVARGNAGYGWFCWLRSDAAGRYHRFIHLRHLDTRRDLVDIVCALSGRPWMPENHLYGALFSPEQAEYHRQQNDRLDRRLRERGAWSDVEKDDSMGGAIPEHLYAHEAAKKGGNE